MSGMENITYKTKIVDGQEVCFSSDWIYDLEKEIHFNWYYHQAEMVYRNLDRNEKILEIGSGTGLLSDLLNRRKWRINTLDIDAEKHPDFCESAIDFNYAKHDIDSVLAFEIFEHIPYETFQKLIEKFNQEKVKKILFSVPWNEIPVASLELKLPKLPKLQAILRFPKNRITTRAHFWELSKNPKVQDDNKRLIKPSQMISLFVKNGYTVETQKKIGYIQYFSATLD